MTIALLLLLCIGSPGWFYLGFMIGMRTQYRAIRGLAPPALSFERQSKVEVHGEDDPQPDERVTQLTTELEALDNERLRSAAEFHQVPFDDRKSARRGVIESIVKAHFNPGVFRA